MRDVNEDTAANDIVIDAWQEAGNETRVIRSHRRPRSARRGPVALLALAAAVSMGITLTTVAAEPKQTATAQAVFSQPNEDELIDRLFAQPASRSDRDDIEDLKQELLAEPHVKPKSTKPKTTPKPVARWKAPTTPIATTSCYGYRWGRMHAGIDFNGETGDKVRSVGAGTVVQAGWRYSGLGYSVVVRHSGGWMTLYGHLSKVTARPGQKVSAGDLVGLMGSTGHSTGSHLHFGVAKASSPDKIFNAFVNPAPWLKARGVSAGRC